ncbi:MAG TPA: ParB/RepB/Spo0J family partition protein [Dehalococcoidia bacterium]|nr:ParB/RepB/Spo0J family partition protein [Dehalococcoidia bacterium]
MGKRFDLTTLAKEESFVPPAFKLNVPAPVEPIEISADADYRLIPVAAIALNPLNERPAEDDEGIEGLAATLRDYGVIQPLLVCSVAAFIQRYPAEAPRLDGAEWVTLIGNRRLRAARRVQVADVPAIINDERVDSMYRAMLIENLQHQAMPPLHEAEAMAKAMKEEGLSQRALAVQIGKTQGFVSQRLALLKLVPELRQAVVHGDLTVELARTFGELAVTEQQVIAARGKPYRRQNTTGSDAGVRRGWASSPARAAHAIRDKFTDPNELSEVVRLLNDHLATLRSDSQ